MHEIGTGTAWCSSTRRRLQRGLKPPGSLVYQVWLFPKWGAILVFSPLRLSRRPGFERASVRRHLLRVPNLLEEQPAMPVRTYPCHLLHPHLAGSAVEPLEHSGIAIRCGCPMRRKHTAVETEIL